MPTRKGATDNTDSMRTRLKLKSHRGEGRV
jgi:hypothetical protein